MLKRKLTLILLGYILGIIMELYFEKGIALFVLVILIFGVIIKYVKLASKSFLNHKMFYRVKRVQKYLKIVLKMEIICVFMCSFMIGVIYTKYLNYGYDNLYLGIQEGDFIGIIQSNPEEKEYNTRYKIRVQSINNDSKYKNTNLYLFVSKETQKFEYGDLISFRGEFIEPQTQKNYEGFDYKEYLKTLKIYGTLKCVNDKIELCDKNRVNFLSFKINDLSNKIKGNTYKLFKQKEANLLIGILIGDTSNIDENLENNFRNSSLLHILAVSGTHINYIILSLIYLNSKLKISKKIGRVITIIILILFMFLVGFSASVVRAVIMGITILVAQLFYRKLDIINSISFSALVLLLINPFNIINSGFLLSYGGTIGIVSLSKNFSNIFIKKNKQSSLILKEKVYINNLINSIKEILIITISAQIIIMPITLRLFNTISLTFFISNLLVGPIMGFVTVFGFITVFISFISVSIAKILAFPLHIMIKFLIFIAEFFGSMKISKIYVVTIPMIFIVIYYVCVYIINYFLYLRYNDVGADDPVRPIIRYWFKELACSFKIHYKKILIYFILILIIFNIYSNLTKEFTINFIDVGQR
ncbi:MAG: ComEC/Rec2 family competence protein [Clostridia bacterium]|nr:ComEC/Rec2 family competence protein [Clostridia bacterium]